MARGASQNRDRRMEDAKSSAGAVSVDGKGSCRLHPSLPQTDRWEAGVPQGARGLHGRSTDAQAEAKLLVLEEQKNELLLINEKWATEYRTMKHFYSEKVRELRTILQLSNSRTGEDAHGEERKTEAGLKVKGEDGVKAEEVGSLSRRWQHQRQEIRRLNEALQGALQAGYASSETLADVWRHQAEVYREDFLKERSDREKLHGRYLELEKKYRKACRELRALRPQTPPTKPVADCRCRNAARPQNLSGQPPHKPTCALNYAHH